jgi:hypothetical protein
MEIETSSSEVRRIHIENHRRAAWEKVILATLIALAAVGFGLWRRDRITQPIQEDTQLR